MKIGIACFATSSSWRIQLNLTSEDPNLAESNPETESLNTPTTYEWGVVEMVVVSVKHHNRCDVCEELVPEMEGHYDMKPECRIEVLHRE